MNNPWPPDQTPETAATEVSLRPYVEIVKKYRYVIGLCVGIGALVWLIATIAAYILLPIERTGTVQFRLLFAGAEDNKYPNQQPFNAAEIVAPTVLADVFAANDLKRFGTIDDFQHSMFVLKDNLALQQLDSEYQSRLADTRLSSVDRARIEDDFRRKREAVKDPEFSLSIRRTERIAEMPRPLLEKVLTDTLAAWAKQAIERKGSTRPDLNVISRNVFDRAENSSEHYLVRVDVLRDGAQRLLDTLMALEKVPGAPAVRTTDQDSVANVKAAVEDIMMFEIEPMLGYVRLAGSSPRDRVLLSAYISDSLLRKQLDRTEAAAHAVALQNGLREYASQRGDAIVDQSRDGRASAAPANVSPQVIPQLSESFIDRLMDLSASTHDQDVLYRQNLTNEFLQAQTQVAALDKEIAYYEGLQRQISQSITGGTDPAISAILNTRFNRTLKELLELSDRSQKIYNEISLQTMNPTRQLYAVTQPFMLQTFPALVLRTIILSLALTLLITLTGAIIGCFIHNGRSQQKERAFAYAGPART